MSQSPWRGGLPLLISFASGVLFSAGLAIAGMTRPSKVLAFLDLAGAWDPSLALVMLGAIPVYCLANAFMRRRSRPMAAGSFHLPTRRDLEPKLVVGAAIFGVGWGLAGYCPGPALTALGTGARGSVLFVLAMAAGMLLSELSTRVARSWSLGQQGAEADG